MEDSRIVAELEFENAYKDYTEASNRVYNATSDAEKKVEKERFEIASRRFDSAYKRLKEIESNS